MAREHGVQELKTSAKLLFTLIAAVLLVVGAVAIATETYTGYVRGKGQATVVGEGAVFIGQTLILLSALPLLVCVPKKWIGVAGFTLWIGLMLWIFGSLYLK